MANRLNELSPAALSAAMRGGINTWGRWARAFGAEHKRERLWIVSYPRGEGWEGFEPHNGIFKRAQAALAKHGHGALGDWRTLVADQHLVRSGDGLSVGVERRRIHALGNAVVPQIPEIIGRAILEAEGVNARPPSAESASTK